VQAAKDLMFPLKKTININGYLLDMSKPKIMGILNITSDSFFDGGKYHSDKEILLQTEKMLTEGADIIDVGAQSTRPGAIEIPLAVEQEKIENAIKIINKEFPTSIISADTYRAAVARRAVESGANIINDISAGNLDDKMFNTVAELKVPYIMMHMRGNPASMQSLTHYENLILEVVMYFQDKIRKAREIGIHEIIVDPGFGFAKTLENNYDLLKKLSYLKVLGYPILLGVSRKSMIGKVLNTNARESLNGTTVLNTFGLLQGANILRVHDVKEAYQAIALIQKLTN
jgi:dihydropteroate synthase